MNGRAYDPELGRFTGVDPLVQEPINSQSLNPYSYVMNNPLAGTDPTGYCSTDDAVKECAGQLKEGEVKAVTNKDGKEVGTVGKDKHGNLHFTKNGGEKGQKMIAKTISAVNKIGDPSDRGRGSAYENLSNYEGKPIDDFSKKAGLAGAKESDFQAAADKLGVDAASVRTVADVESKGSGFLESGDPTILFEAHIFSKLTGGKYDDSHPDISSKKWDRSLYKGGQLEHIRLAAAMALDPDAAIQSASWGKFQIMGMNYKAAGFNSPQEFARAMWTNEGAQLKAFTSFISSNNRLLTALRGRDWAKFARIYNGPGYSTHSPPYDKRLQNSYRNNTQFIFR